MKLILLDLCILDDDIAACNSLALMFVVEDY
jgi:hypothetical protein